MIYAVHLYDRAGSAVDVCVVAVVKMELILRGYAAPALVEVEQLELSVFEVGNDVAHSSFRRHVENTVFFH